MQEILETVLTPAYLILGVFATLFFGVISNAIWAGIARIAPLLPGALLSYLRKTVMQEDDRVNFLASNSTVLICESYKVLLGVCGFVGTVFGWLLFSQIRKLNKLTQEPSLNDTVTLVWLTSGVVVLYLLSAYLFYTTYNRARIVHKAIAQYERRLRALAATDKEPTAE